MKIYQKPIVLIENLSISEWIASCNITLRGSDAGCDTDAWNKLYDDAWSEIDQKGYFTEGLNCRSIITAGDGYLEGNGYCLHTQSDMTSAGTLFPS